MNICFFLQKCSVNGGKYVCQYATVMRTKREALTCSGEDYWYKGWKMYRAQLFMIIILLVSLF